MKEPISGADRAVRIIITAAWVVVALTVASIVASELGQRPHANQLVLWGWMVGMVVPAYRAIWERNVTLARRTGAWSAGMVATIAVFEISGLALLGGADFLIATNSGGAAIAASVALGAARFAVVGLLAWWLPGKILEGKLHPPETLT